MTVQANKDEVNVNSIIARFIKTGDASVFNQRVGTYADVSNIGDYAACQEMLKNAQESFATLPARVRDAFKNDPGLLAEALQDVNRRPELEALGIMVPTPTGDAKDNSSSGNKMALEGEAK